MIIKIKKLNENAIIPNYGTENSAGMDLYSVTETNIYPNEIKVIPIGISIELPVGYFGLVCSRSGLAAKYGISILNSPGIIDADYRGEIKCILHNCSNSVFVIKTGMKVAQLLILNYDCVQWQLAESLSCTKREDNGFGSTGL